MRDLIISLTLFVLLIGAIWGNSVYILSGTREITDLIEEVPSFDSVECEKRIDQLRVSFQKFKKVAQLSLEYSELNRMECLIEELDCHRRSGNINDFEHAKVMMKNVIKEIERYEKVTLDGVM